MNRIVEEVDGFIVAAGIIAGFVYALGWAYEKEQRLGIDTMSSERILVREEMKK